MGMYSDTEANQNEESDSQRTWPRTSCHSWQAAKYSRLYACLISVFSYSWLIWYEKKIF